MPTTTYLGYLETDYLVGPYLTDYQALGAVGMQIELIIVDRPKALAMEVERIVQNALEPVGIEVERFIDDFPTARGMEVLRVIRDFPEPLGAQVSRTIANRPDPQAMQILRIIVDRPDAAGMQVDRLNAALIGMQVTLRLYNVNRLRILADFPSRGVDGLNWTATSTEVGDFDVNNVNTDIVEQVWRSETGTTSVTLTSDTQITQGSAIDTLALLNHNLTTSAVVTVEGSDNPSFAPVEQSFNLEATRLNAYYIAPEFPPLQSHYWRIIIADPTNPNSFLQIGTIVYGTAIIFQGECFTDNVRRQRKHFADKIPTEGFTSYSNDRALKRAIGLEFRMLAFQGGNWRSIDNLFDLVRTSLKALWIPDPQDPERFGIFGKLATIPDELHRNLGDEASDTLDFSIELDESL
jgi:hypothetical protein